MPGAAVSAGLFSMLGVQLALGRDIAAADDQPGAAPVVVLTDGLWRRRYQGDPAIVGKPILVDDRPHTVIGVLLMDAVRTAVRESDAGLPIFAVASMEELRRKGFWQYELFGWMFSIFGALALLLGSAGVYGVLSYSVSQRTQELGVRRALGATAGDVLRLTVMQGLKLVAAGVLVGVVGAVAITRLIATLLYDVSPTDPVSFAAVALLLGAVGLLASYLPARRAARVDPLTALRVD